MKKIFSLVLLGVMVIFTSCKKDEATIVTPDQVSLNKTTIGLVIGTTETLIATISPANADVKDINWVSCDEKVATVSNTGVVTAVSVGKATITAVTVSGGKSASCVVLVTGDRVAVTGVTLDKATLTLAPEAKYQLVSTIAPVDATNSNVKWSTDNDKAATVSPTGEVTAVATGTAKITVTTEDGNKTAVCTVTVGVETPPYIYYGSKYRKLVYVDGANIKYVEGGEGYYAKSAFRVGDDFYALATKMSATGSTFLFLKNGVVVDGKIPTEESINEVAGDANAIYAVGFMGSDRACWKNGTLLFSVKGGAGFVDMAVLNGDVFIGRLTEDKSKLELFKNNATTIIETPLPSGMVTIRSMFTSQDKIYLTLMSSENKAYLYSCDGNTIKKETEKVVTSIGTIRNVDAKTNFFTLFRQEDKTSLVFKNTSWETALPQLSPVEGFKYPSADFNVIVDGNDTYTYAGCSNDAKKNEAYYWKNSLNPVRMPSDTVYFVIHKTR